MPKARVLLSALLTALLPLGTVTAQEVLPVVTPAEAGLASGPIEQITDVLRDAVSSGDIAGAVTGVARRGQVAYLEAVGLQDIERRTPMTDGTLFRIYSMTKSVTAVAAMMLHEEGRFELTDPVSEYLPEFARVVVEGEDGNTRPPARPITVEHLLLHTSGLNHRFSAEYREAGVRARDISLEQFVDNIVAVPLRFEPGEGYLYSASPTVLGRLVEVWSGQTFDAFVRERILEPLGMNDTEFWVEQGAVDRFATMYSAEGGQLRAYQIEDVPFTQRPTLMEGAVGLVSTVPDFLRFAQMLLDGGRLGDVRLLSESTVAEMTQNGLSEDLLARRRGRMGWGAAQVEVVVDPAAAGGGVGAGEYGWNGSAGTEFWIDPTRETVVVTMWQNSPSNPDGLRQRIKSLVREAADAMASDRR